MDENAIALAMAYSLQLADVHCEVMLVQDNKLSFLGLIVLVDNEYVLGYIYGVASQKIASVTRCNW